MGAVDIPSRFMGMKPKTAVVHVCFVSFLVAYEVEVEQFSSSLSVVVDGVSSHELMCPWDGMDGWTVGWWDGRYHLGMWHDVMTLSRPRL